MIFVTVGGQMPFDRLLKAVDDWAVRSGRTDIIAQIGPNAWRPSHLDWVEFMPPAEYRMHIEKAELVIAHAGMGTIIGCLECAKPLIVLPRRARYGETRNDHQVDTAKKFAAMRRLVLCEDEEALCRELDEPSVMKGVERLGPFASPSLLERLCRFIDEGP